MTGLKIAAHYYNHTWLPIKGRLDAVMFGKILDSEQRKALVWDVERGAPDKIVDEPWQSCSCIGGWHYNTSIYENNGYKSAASVVKLLVDIVSKNGNLLLSVPLRADGTFDEKEEAILNDFGDWMTVNKEGIIDTRPWKFWRGTYSRIDCSHECAKGSMKELTTRLLPKKYVTPRKR
jgi:alpha-L-fucosidase